MADPIENLADVRDGFDRTVHQFERAHERRAAVSGSDSSKQVTVRTSPDGEVLDILISPQWIHALDPESLGAAVIEAYSNAGIASANEWGEALSDEVARPEPMTRPLPDAADSLYAQLDAIVSPETLLRQGEASMHAMVALLEEVLDDVDRVSSDVTSLAERRLVAEMQGGSVTLSGLGHLLAVSVDAGWAERTNAASIARHLLGAYKDARRQARAQTVDDIVSSSSLGEVQRLAGDPRALAARLRLT